MYLRKRLRDCLRQTLYYGIMVDETTDKASEQQLILYIKHLDRDKHGNPKIVVEFLDLVSLPSGGAEDLMVIDLTCSLANLI